MTRLLLTLLVLSLPQVTFARSLPQGLSSADVSHVVGVLGVGASSRLVRSSEAYPLFPGIKVGVEISFFPTEDLNYLGFRNGSLPSLQPMPRLFVSKGIFPNLELSANFFPSSISSLPASLGGMLKWNLIHEKTSEIEGAVYTGYTIIDSYNGDFKGNTFELGGTLSRDFVEMRPYVGLGLLVASGTVNQQLVPSGINSGLSSNLRAFMGIELELPLNIAMQIDLSNLASNSVSLASSLFIGKRF